MIGTLLDASIRVSLVAAAVAALLLVMRVRSSSARHAAWTSVLAAMLLMPILPRVVPASGVIDVPLPLASRAAPPVLDIVDGPASDSGATPLASATPVTTSASAAITPRNIVSAVRVTGQGLLVSLYVLGVAVLLLRLAIGWAAARSLARVSDVVSLSDGLRVRISMRVATPLTIGVLSPAIVLPAAWADWAPGKLQAVLAHERAHIARRDPLVAFLAHVNHCVFWFHPLAWWLERRLAVTAEHACDDAAVSAVGEGRRYAAVLLEIADTVRRRGGRVAWQGLGVDGSGLLGQRIDRVMSGEALRCTSRAGRIGIGLGCAAAIFIAVACRQEIKAAPLREDPEVAKRLLEQASNREFYKAAESMTAQLVDALEAELLKNPADFDAVKKLRVFYWNSGQKVFGWDEMVARRRPHILRLIDQYPDNDAAVWTVSASADAVTYAAAKERWLAQSEKPAVSVKTLSNAARFFERDEPSLAEGLMLRAKALDPDGTTLRITPGPAPNGYWATRLGYFYGEAILGPRDPKDGRPIRPLDADPFAKALRTRLETSTDATMLAAAGSRLIRGSYFDPARGQIGREYLERALKLDPSGASPVLTDARRTLFALDDMERRRSVSDMLRMKRAELAGGEILRKVRAGERLTDGEAQALRAFEYDALSALPVEERLPALAGLADSAYAWAEQFAYTTKDEAGARASYERSKKAAQEALLLATASRKHPGYSAAVYRATVALGVHALREGDRVSAVRYMREAVKVPPSEGLAYGSPASLDDRLVKYLLKSGERDSVAEFLEKSAELRTADRAQRLRDAAAIREGRMPMAYQYTVSRE